MAQPPLSMHHIREILRLHYHHHLSGREIARSCGLPSSTVADYLQRARAAGLNWPLPEALTDPQLLERLLGPEETCPSTSLPRPLPDWAQVHQELRRPNLTLQLLWQEYHQNHPQGYAYSRYCQLYRQWAGTLEPSLRLAHVPGEKLFVDWAGQTVPIRQAGTDVVSQASVFVAVLGFSNQLYAEAFPDQQLASWIAGHAHAYAFYHGVARVTVPDNPKTAVIYACRYEPVLHRTYQEMAEHYGTVVIPARVVRPRDKE